MLPSDIGISRPSFSTAEALLVPRLIHQNGLSYGVRFSASEMGSTRWQTRPCSASYHNMFCAGVKIRNLLLVKSALGISTMATTIIRISCYVARGMNVHSILLAAGVSLDHHLFRLGFIILSYHTPNWSR